MLFFHGLLCHLGKCVSSMVTSLVGFEMMKSAMVVTKIVVQKSSCCECAQIRIGHARFGFFAYMAEADLIGCCCYLCSSKSELYTYLGSLVPT